MRIYKIIFQIFLGFFQGKTFKLKFEGRVRDVEWIARGREDWTGAH